MVTALVVCAAALLGGLLLRVLLAAGDRSREDSRQDATFGRFGNRDSRSGSDYWNPPWNR
jgi:hypothetical protein